MSEHAAEEKEEHRSLLDEIHPQYEGKERTHAVRAKIFKPKRTTLELVFTTEKAETEPTKAPQ